MYDFPNAIHVKVEQSTHRWWWKDFLANHQRCMKRLCIVLWLEDVILYTGDWCKISSVWFNVWGKVVWWRSLSVRSVFVTAYCPFLIILEIWDSVFCTSYTDKRQWDILQCDQTPNVTVGDFRGWCFLFDELTDVPNYTVLQAYSWLPQERQDLVNMCDLD